MKDHIFNVHDVVLLMTMAECFLLAIFQAVLPITNRTASALLTSFLLCVAVSLGCTLILWNDFVTTNAFFDRALLPYFLMAGLMLKGPALYLYVCALTQDSFRLKFVHLLHLLPTLLCFLWLLFLQIDSLDLRFRAPDATEHINFLANQVWHASKIVPLVYVIAAAILMHNYNIGLKNQYSEFSTTEPGWLNILTLGFLFSWSMTLVVHVLAQTSTPQLSDAMGIADNYVTFILMNGLFTYSVVYAHKLLTTKPEPAKDKTEEKLTDIAIAKVHEGMENAKLYLKQNLNIEEFSKRIDLPVKEVSAVINKHYGTNFFEFMNSYRITEAKRLLSDPENAEMTVLDILLQSGFNSKSAFHRFFNRLVGVSPTEYRKQELNKR